MSGLTSRQLHALEHITRCTCCGSWELISDAELRMRAAGHLDPLTHCEHLDPHLVKEAS